MLVLAQSGRKVVAGQVVEDPTEHVVAFGADLVAQFTLEVSDSLRQLGQDAVALGGAPHADGSSIVGILLHRDQFEFLEFTNSLTDWRQKDIDPAKESSSACGLPLMTCPTLPPASVQVSCEIVFPGNNRYQFPDPLPHPVTPLVPEEQEGT